jgi:hypothetical protein
MSVDTFRNLPTKEQCLVAVAVLLDGVDAVAFLVNDKLYGSQMATAARELSSLEPELRMPLVGTLLRESVRYLEGSAGKTIY